MLPRGHSVDVQRNKHAAGGGVVQCHAAGNGAVLSVHQGGGDRLHMLFGHHGQCEGYGGEGGQEVGL